MVANEKRKEEEVPAYRVVVQSMQRDNNNESKIQNTGKKKTALLEWGH